MSRFNVILVGADRTDPAAVIGYDRLLRTFFLQGFELRQTISKNRKSGSELRWRNFQHWKIWSRKPYIVCPLIERSIQ